MASTRAADGDLLGIGDLAEAVVALALGVTVPLDGLEVDRDAGDRRRQRPRGPTVNERVAGVGSPLPAASKARTEKVWEPWASPPYGCGLEQSANAPPSRLHWKAEPGSEDAKPNSVLPAAIVDPSAGPSVIVVSGAIVSALAPAVQEAGGTFASADPVEERGRVVRAVPLVEDRQVDGVARPGATGVEARSSEVAPS